MRFTARYKSQDTQIKTKGHQTPDLAWAALGKTLVRHGINPGPWHMPGTVSGDGNGPVYQLAVSRANGSATIDMVD